MIGILYYLSSFFLISGIFIAIYIVIDLKKKPQKMKIMNVVWVLTALWGNYLTLWAYRKFGRSEVPCNMSNMEKDDSMQDMKMDDINMKKSRPKWQSIALSALHCGAGCTLADIIGETITNHYPVLIFSSHIIGSWVFDFILALSIGIFFQYYAISEIEKISFLSGISRAFKADFFSLLSWQLGMYGWMAIVYFVLFSEQGLSKSNLIFWFMMQIAMLFGFVFAYPMNFLLMKLGIKRGM